LDQTAPARGTTIRLLLGYLHPTAGRGRVLGLDIVGDSVAIRPTDRLLCRAASRCTTRSPASSSSITSPS